MIALFLKRVKFFSYINKNSSGIAQFPEYFFLFYKHLLTLEIIALMVISHQMHKAVQHHTGKFLFERDGEFCSIASDSIEADEDIPQLIGKPEIREGIIIFKSECKNIGSLILVPVLGIESAYLIIAEICDGEIPRHLKLLYHTLQTRCIKAYIIQPSLFTFCKIYLVHPQSLSYSIL